MIKVPNRWSGNCLCPIQPLASGVNTALETHKKKSDYNKKKKKDGQKKSSKLKLHARLEAKIKPSLSARTL